MKIFICGGGAEAGLSGLIITLHRAIRARVLHARGAAAPVEIPGRDASPQASHDLGGLPSRRRPSFQKGRGGWPSGPKLQARSAVYGTGGV